MIGRSKLVVFVIAAVLACALGYFAYPVAIFQCFAKTATPEDWNAALYSLSKGQLVAKLGKPAADMSAKGFIAWEDHRWWGSQTLMVTFANCCSDTSVPSHIFVIKHARYRYKPIETREIREGGIGADTR